MSSLPSTLRRQLETAIKHARQIAEGGARKALEALAVHEPDPYRFMNDGQRHLRRKLRAQAKQLGDGESQAKPGAYEIKHLVEKLAYDQWHRLLFARYLLENTLLISPEHGVSVSLDDCEELAPSLGLKDAWAVAARFAARELPEIFRADDPAGEVELPVEDRSPLIQLVIGLPTEVFIASDSLGWCYQFWQAERKDEVNASGSKIGADELPAVTQLFTEDYMVDFLLDNTLGAWHAGKVLAAGPRLVETAQTEAELRTAAALPGCSWKYLRFIKTEDGKWTPAAGTFEGWPKTAKELTCLDPCMGSGHFVVAMFARLVALRIAEEQLDQSVAVASVIRDNLFGLEIDPRCTQIAAFNLALVAWRLAGHCALPPMNLACSGLAPNAKREDWLKLAADNSALRFPMGALYDLFQKAPVLGSLIDPRRNKAVNYSTKLEDLQPLLDKALSNEIKDDAFHEMAVTARGVAKAAEILADHFTLVATNVPYLGRGKQVDVLQMFCDENHSDAKADLSTCFVERCIQFARPNSTIAVVSPQNWLFLATYRAFRKQLTRRGTWELVTRLGPNAFQDMNWWHATTALIVYSSNAPTTEHIVLGLDVSTHKDQGHKAILLRGAEVDGESAKLHSGAQATFDADPETRIVLRDSEAVEKLSDYAVPHTGMQTGDNEHYSFAFWELPQRTKEWEFFHRTSERTLHYGGRFPILRWENGSGSLAVEPGRRIAGLNCLGHTGILVHRMNQLPVTLYTGEIFDQNGAVILTNTADDLTAAWCYLSSDSYRQEVRCLDTKTGVTPKTLAAVPFDIEQWRTFAAKQYPHGLPKPFSSDPTQWLFNGHPKGSDQPLHVAVARLLGYQWPRQTGSSFSECPALGLDGLEDLADEDGIVCLFPTKGEAPANERLRAMLVQALGECDLRGLISSAGPKGSKSETLEEWLRNEFFEQHCALFHQCPFIWHLWDGLKNGFSALVNYHQLTHANLEKLTYAYLGDWIRRQQGFVDAGEAGSDARLQAAKQLQTRLKLILEGEPPYDIFVRWKPLSQQAIGWNPDINDGVRMNIRPFATADILRKRVKIKWDKDRGNEQARHKEDFPWFWGWDGKTQDFSGVGKEPDGNRWNDCHYTNEFKKRAREAHKGQ